MTAETKRIDPLRAFLIVCCLAGCATAARATFEDIYGPSRASFQGALGFRVAEATGATGDALTSFGVAVDDMVVQWREYKLIDDATECSTSGACASVSVDSGIAHESNGSLTITVIDASPYGQASPVNDCNQDGDFVDGGIDDQDCDDDGTTDVVARASSIAEPSGELVVLNRLAGTSAYRGTLPISTVANVVGVLMYSDSGVSFPEITIRYADRWDGSASGIECRASSNPAEWGFVSASVDIPTTRGHAAIVTYRVSDVPGTGTPPLPAGQDGDGIPDTNETVDLFLTMRNATSQPLTRLVAQVSSSDPKIACILQSISMVDSVPAHTNVDLPIAVRFKVASTADRSGVVPPVTCVAGACSNGAGVCILASDCAKTVNSDYAATLSVLLTADQFEAATAPQTLRVELDLNLAAPVKATSTLVEGFEAGLANMTLMNLDASFASNTLSNGMRCQYNDPDFLGSNSYGDTECYLGFAAGQSVVNDWHVHDITDVGGGRSYQGSRSLHYGIHTFGDAELDTYGLSQMDAIRTKGAINLAARLCRDDPSADKRACNSAVDCAGFGGGPCVSADPELSFKHQLALDIRRELEGAQDRAIVAAQLSTPGAIWQKLAPYENGYDIEGTDNFSNCMFDPIDDGNTEDDYYDPNDPDRRYGPSSTCRPEFVFAFIGDTDEPFHPSKIGRADEGPGLQGALGPGTWVESKFDLSRFRGRQIRIRWLLTSLKVSDVATYEALFHHNPDPTDDGWYVDDVRVTQTLGTSAPTVSLDTRDTSALPACGVACSSVAAALAASPSITPTPGRMIGLSTEGSLADRCNGGALLSEFWIDGDANGVLGDPTDVRLRAPTLDPLFEDAPLVTTRYAARVFCSSSPACSATAFVTVTVGCPGTPGVYNAEAWWARLRFADTQTITVPPAGQSIDAVRGDLGALRATGSFLGAICLADGSSSPTLLDATLPASGQGFYYLMRGADFACNENRSWSTFSAKENPTDPARRDAQITACSP